jgi:hypothetical protein
VNARRGAFRKRRSIPSFEEGNYDPGVRTHANSMYLNTLAEQGIVGFAILLLIVAVSIAVFTRRLSEPLIAGACAAAFALALHQVVDSMWLYPKVGVIWWVLIAAAAAHRDATDAKLAIDPHRVSGAPSTTVYAPRGGSRTSA